METIEINGIAFGGAGLGHIKNGKICFVHGTIPGETVKIEVTDEFSAYAYGKLLEVVKPSPFRIEPECPHAINGKVTATSCPGCTYAHTTYKTELKWKQKQLTDFLTRGNLAPEAVVQPPVAAPKRFGWRNKIRLTVETGADGVRRWGYRGFDNETLIPLENCPLARKSIQEAIAAGHPEKIPGNIAHVTFRWTLRNGVLTRESNQKTEPKMLCEQVGSHGDFMVPENSFFQINVPMASLLAEQASFFIMKSHASYVLELYCGIGVLSMIAAERLKHIQVRGIELDKTAINAANLNARKRRVADRCRYFDGDAEESFPALSMKYPAEQSLVLVDPPRCGLTSTLIHRILSYGPQTVVYISCAPDTLRRDLVEFTKDKKYRIVSAQLFDMFPTTAHFETLVLLEKTK